MQYGLGYFDDETCRPEPIDNPFGPKLLRMSPEWTPAFIGSSGWIRTSNPPVKSVTRVYFLVGSSWGAGRTRGCCYPVFGNKLFTD
jgi:hypothetical protein